MNDRASNVAKESAKPKTRRGRRIFRTVLLSITALLILGAGTIYYLLRATPDMVRKQDKYEANLTEQDKDRIASNVEGEFTQALFGPPPGVATSDAPLLGPNTAHASDRSADPTAPENLYGPRQFRVPLPEANLWLGRKMPEWLAQQGVNLPAAIGNFMIDGQGDQLRLGFRVDTRELPNQHVVAGLRVEIQRGVARVKLTDMRGGKMPLPAGMVADAVKKTAGTEAMKKQIDQILNVIDGAELPLDFVGDGKRDIRVDNLRIEEGDVVLDMALVPKRGS